MLLLQINFFDLIDTRTSFFASFSSYSQKKLLLVIAFAYMFVRSIAYGINYKRKKNYTLFVILFLISWVAILLATVSIYGQSIVKTLFVSYYFLLLILYFPFSEALSSKESWRTLIKIFSDFAFILSLIKIFQSLMISKFNKVFFFMSNNDYNTATSLRFVKFGFTRMPSPTDFVFISLLLTLFSVFIGLKLFTKWRYRLYIGVYIIFIFLIGQTRSYIIMTILVLLLYALWLINKHFGKDLVILTVGILAIPVLFLMTKFIINIIFGNSSRGISLSIRQEAIKYYLQNISLHKWFSLGFVRDDLFSNLVHNTHIDFAGNVYSYNYDDVGVVGLIAQYGWLGILNISIYFLTTLSIFIKSHSKYLLLFIFVLLFGSWTSVSLFDPQRIFYLPILLVLIDSIGNNILKSDFYGGSTDV
ncbi:putative membrane protein [Pediococcus pentosaceus IE-3]|nr:putative membrane protein [Pediococcus pentosaceus IE-3]